MVNRVPPPVARVMAPSNLRAPRGLPATRGYTRFWFHQG
jgi:hypothetical protein